MQTGRPPSVVGTPSRERCARTVLSQALLLACAALAAAAAAPPAWAQAAPEPARAAARYDIPAGTLDQVLNRFAAQAGVLLAIDGTLTAGKASAGLAGSYGLQEGFAAILANSGLQAVAQPGGGYALRKAAGSPAAAPSVPDARPEATLPVTRVTASPEARSSELPRPYAGGQVARGARIGLLGNTDVFDTPFNVSSYTSALIRDQQARDLSDVLLNDVSVRAVGDSRFGINSIFFVRGLTLYGFDASWDGLFGLVNGRRQGLPGIERIDLLKGPSTLLNGISPQQSVAGSLNFVPKRAADAPVSSFGLGYASKASLETRFDLGRRFGPENAMGVRVNAAYADGDTAIDKNRSNNRDASVALDYRSARVRTTLDLVHSQQQVDAPLRGYGLAPGVPVPAAPDARRNAQQPWEFYGNKSAFAVARTELDLNDRTTLYAALGRAHQQETGIGAIHRIVDAAGTTSGSLRSPQSTDMQVRTTAESGIRTVFSTGAIDHKLVASVNWSRDVSDVRDGYTGRNSQSQTAVSNIYRPVDVGQQYVLSEARTRDPWYRTTVSSAAVADTLSMFDDTVLLTLGGRYQKIKSDDYDFYSVGQPAFGTIVSSTDQHAFSPAAGLVVKPGRMLSLYANYIEGLQQGASADAGTANEFQRFPPYRTKQVEAGVKLDLGTLGVTAAVYQIVLPSALIDADNVFTQGGQQRNRGIELNLFGEPVPRVRVLGGLAWNDARLTRTTGGVNQGHRAVGVPDVQLNLYAEYDTPWLPGLSLDGRAVYTSSQFADAENVRKIPDWWRFDIGTRYVLPQGLGKRTALRASVDNVFGRNYWQTAAFSRLVSGPPRTVKLSATVDF